MDFWTGYWAFCSFVFGAIVGSFLNVCIWRLPRQESLSNPPSHCPSCNHRLAFVPDMIPILSQLWYRSRCRYCGQKFSWRYLWVELFTAVVFVAVFFRYVPYGNEAHSEVVRNWSALCGMLFSAALITIFFIDLATYEIPDITVLAAVVFAVAKDAFMIQQGARSLWQTIPGIPWQVPIPLSILQTLMAFWLLWQFIAIATAVLGREAMGGGDALLLGAMGSFLIPWPLIIIAFISAVALGTVGGLAGMWLYRAPEKAPEAAGPETATAMEQGDPAATSDKQESASTAGDPPVGEPETLSSHRGAAEAPDPAGKAPEEEDQIPQLPASSRWGRLVTVAGTWAAVGALWGAAAYVNSSLPTAAAILVGAGLLAFFLLRFGLRLWLAEEQGWTEEMDELFENDPGPRFIPFGPYLVAGTFIAMLFGRPLIEWYVSTIGISVGRLPWD